MDTDAQTEKGKCLTCVFCDYPLNSPTFRDGHYFIGRCKKHSPSLGGYPITYADDWCGDYEQRMMN